MRARELGTRFGYGLLSGGRAASFLAVAMGALAVASATLMILDMKSPSLSGPSCANNSLSNKLGSQGRPGAELARRGSGPPAERARERGLIGIAQIRGDGGDRDVSFL
jgi:hypothetical protein